MTYSEPFIQLTVQGDAWASVEQWQFGVKVRPADPVVQDVELQSLADALAAPTQAFYSNAALRLSQFARLLSIKAAWVNQDGVYPPDSAPGIYTYPAPVSGTVTTACVPQATVAVTLLTEFPRGRASRGRFYLPPFCPQATTDGRLTAVDADAMEAAARTWLNAIKATTEVSDVLVMSRLGAGRTGVVGSVGVGRVIDTMRSRRRNLVEARTPVAL